MLLLTLFPPFSEQMTNIETRQKCLPHCFLIPHVPQWQRIELASWPTLTDRPPKLHPTCVAHNVSPDGSCKSIK